MKDYLEIRKSLTNDESLAFAKPMLAAVRSNKL